jgi:putative tryptophan/tyrosine transport system substrate-binding protein
MRRRHFITLASSVAVMWPLAARAQQPSIPVIGFLNSAAPETFAPFLAAFHRGLKEADYIEDRNVKIANIVGQKAIMIDCQRWRPIWFVVRWP